MKNKAIILMFICSLCFFVFCVFTYNKKEVRILNSEYYPSSSLMFEKHAYKLKKNIKQVIKLKNGEIDKVKYFNEDASKIKIISSSHLGLIIEKISDFEKELTIRAQNIEYPELNDVVYLSSFNEFLLIENLFVYQKGINDLSKDSIINLSDGEFYFEFKIKTLFENTSLEEESIHELCINLKDFFMEEVIYENPLYYDLCYKININIKKVFQYELRKTLSFTIDRASFAYTFTKAI